MNSLSAKQFAQVWKVRTLLKGERRCKAQGQCQPQLQRGRLSPCSPRDISLPIAPTLLTVISCHCSSHLVPPYKRCSRCYLVHFTISTQLDKAALEQSLWTGDGEQGTIQGSHGQGLSPIIPSLSQHQLPPLSSPLPCSTSRRRRPALSRAFPIWSGFSPVPVHLCAQRANPFTI